MKSRIWVLMIAAVLMAVPLFAEEIQMKVEDIEAEYVAPEVVESVRPNRVFYTPSREVEGYVTVAMLVNEQGEVEEAKVVYRTSKTAVPSAIEAASKWQFKPATVDGETVKAWVAYNLAFGMNLDSYEEVSYEQQLVLDEETVLALNK